MYKDIRKERDNQKGELGSFPSWFLTMTNSPPLLVVFAVTVLLCAPLLLLFGALYPLFKH